jgi:hypothetical protein
VNKPSAPLEDLYVAVSPKVSSLYSPQIAGDNYANYSVGTIPVPLFLSGKALRKNTTLGNPSALHLCELR